MKANKQISQTGVLWHPNFRVVATLPDTKVIRTAFLLNATAAVLLFVAVFALVSRERELREVQALIGAAGQGGLATAIAEGQPKLAPMMKLQVDFAAAEKKLREIEGFATPSLVASEFLNHVSQTLPRLIVLNAIEYRDGIVRLQGTCVGASERATVLAKQYVEKLSQDSVFAVSVGKVRLSKLEREQLTGRLTFEIEMTLKPRK